MPPHSNPRSGSRSIAPPPPASPTPPFVGLAALAGLLLVVLAGSLPATGFAREALELDGVWSGVVDLPDDPLRVVVTFVREGDALSGTIDIPARGAAALPLTVQRSPQGGVIFAIGNEADAATFRGVLEDGLGGARLSGTYQGEGDGRNEVPFALTRTPPAGPGPATDVIAPRYRDAAGRFSVPLPSGWRAVERGEWVTLLDPEGGVRIHLLVLPPGDPAERVAEAWQLVAPEASLQVESRLEPPSDPGVRRTVVVTYETRPGAQVAQASAQLTDDGTYLLLLDADLAALQRRASQANVAMSGFAIEGLAAAGAAAAAPRPFEGELVTAFEAFVATGLERYGIPGAAVAVVQGGEVVYGGGFGVLERGRGAALGPDTPMLIGSAGATLTATLAATLIDEGRVSWETPLGALLPDTAPNGRRDASDGVAAATLRELLCACVDVPRRDFELLFNAGDLSAEDVIASLADLEPLGAAGETFRYSNQLVSAAGYALAAADGADRGDFAAGYAASLQRRLLDPIGMRSTTLSFDRVAAEGSYAAPHALDLDGGYRPAPLSAERTLLPIAPAGAHWSTARDMARWLQTQLEFGEAPQGTRVVSEAALRATWEPQVAVSAERRYALGWFVSENRGARQFSHGGNTLGFTSEIAFWPDEDLGVVVLTNAQATNAFNASVRDRLLELVFDLPARAGADAAFAFERFLATWNELGREAGPPERVPLEPFVGRYRNGALGEVELAWQGDRLRFDAGEFTLEVVAYERDGRVAYLLAGAPFTGLAIDFRFGSDGAAFSIGAGAATYPFVRVP